MESGPGCRASFYAGDRALLLDNICMLADQLHRSAEVEFQALPSSYSNAVRAPRICACVMSACRSSVTSVAAVRLTPYTTAPLSPPLHQENPHAS